MNPDTTTSRDDTAPEMSSLQESLKSNFRQLLHEWIFFQMKFVRDEGLAIPQLFTLRFLYYNKPKDLSSVAEFMGVSKPTVTGLMNTLEKDGFVKRVHSMDDRRRVDIALTAKSLELFKKFETKTTFIIEEFLNSIPEDSQLKLNDTMIALEDKLRGALECKNTEKKGD